MGAGRPTDYTPEQSESICEWIAEGKSLLSWTRENQVGLSTVYQWLRKQSEFAENYARAREDAADTLVDRLSDIADSEEDIQRAKLKCDNIKWVAARMKPKNYSERHNVEHSGPGGGPIDIAHTDRAKRVAGLLERARTRRTGPADE